MRPAPRERSLDEFQYVCVSSVPLSQLWTESFDPSQWTIVLFWAAGEISPGEVLIPLAIVDGHLPAPPLPPAVQGIVYRASSTATDTRTARIRQFSVDDHSAAITPHAAIDHISADDASVTPSSRRSSRHAPSVKTHLFARRCVSYIIRELSNKS